LALVLLATGILLSASLSGAYTDIPSVAAQQTAQNAEGSNNDDLEEVAFGTAGAIAVAAVIVTVGYLYRKQTGLVGHYEDGFTPRDPRDHPTH
jgi:hypothetical protein